MIEKEAWKKDLKKSNNFPGISGEIAIHFAKFFFFKRLTIHHKSKP